MSVPDLIHQLWFLTPEDLGRPAAQPACPTCLDHATARGHARMEAAGAGAGTQLLTLDCGHRLCGEALKGEGGVGGTGVGGTGLCGEPLMGPGQGPQVRQSWGRVGKGAWTVGTGAVVRRCGGMGPGMVCGETLMGQGQGVQGCVVRRSWDRGRGFRAVW